MCAAVRNYLSVAGDLEKELVHQFGQRVIQKKNVPSISLFNSLQDIEQWVL
jgi:hypothetical protein